MVERKTGKKLKCLGSDNGGEYTSREFETYYPKNDIRHKKIVPSTPYYKSVTEMMNGTIIERVRCMLKTAKLSTLF